MHSFVFVSPEFLFEFPKNGAEIRDSVFVIEFDAFFFVEFEALLSVFGIDPDVAVSVDDTVEGDVFRSVIPSPGEDARNALRRHRSRTSGPSDTTVGGHAARWNREGDFDDAFAKGEHKLLRECTVLF